jgi:hypothetical protein
MLQLRQLGDLGGNPPLGNLPLATAAGHLDLAGSGLHDSSDAGVSCPRREITAANTTLGLPLTGETTGGFGPEPRRQCSLDESCRVALLGISAWHTTGPALGGHPKRYLGLA